MTTAALIAFGLGAVGLLAGFLVWQARKAGQQQTALQAAERLAKNTVTTIKEVQHETAGALTTDDARRVLRDHLANR